MNEHEQRTAEEIAVWIGNSLVELGRKLEASGERPPSRAIVNGPTVAIRIGGVTVTVAVGVEEDE